MIVNLVPGEPKNAWSKDRKYIYWVARATKPALPQLFLILMFYGLILVFWIFSFVFIWKNANVFKQKYIYWAILVQHHEYKGIGRNLYFSILSYE
jgi:hypothetical protein